MFYNGFFWALAGGRPEGRLPVSWQHQAPQLPADIDAVLAQVSPEGKAIEGVAAAYMYAAAEKSDQERSEQETKLLRRGELEFARFRPALRYLREGLRCGHADWETRWDQGYRREEPNYQYLRAGASLLAYEALQQSPREGLRTGLEIVAWGEDVARRGTELDVLLAIAITRIGCKSLVHTLGRPGLEPEDCRGVVSALAAYAPPDLGRLLQGIRLQFVVSTLEISGRALAPGGTGPIHFNDLIQREPGGPPYFDVVHERHLANWEAACARSFAIAEPPLASQREEASGEIHREMFGGDSGFLASQLPAAALSFNNRRETLGYVRIVQTIAAARAEQLRVGEFPESSEVLAEVLGEARMDPCAEGQPAPLGYRALGQSVEVWNSGSDGINEGGPPPPSEQIKRHKGSKNKTKKRKGAPNKRSDDQGLRCVLRDS